MLLDLGLGRAGVQPLDDILVLPGVPLQRGHVAGIGRIHGEEIPGQLPGNRQQIRTSADNVDGIVRQGAHVSYEVGVHPGVDLDAPGVGFGDRQRQRIEGVGATGQRGGRRLPSALVEGVSPSPDLDDDRVEARLVHPPHHHPHGVGMGEGRTHDPDGPDLREGSPARERGGAHPRPPCERAPPGGGRHHGRPSTTGPGGALGPRRTPRRRAHQGAPEERQSRHDENRTCGRRAPHFLRLRKNPCSSFDEASPRTPVVRSTLWFSRGSCTRLPRVPAMPALGSVAP